MSVNNPRGLTMQNRVLVTGTTRGIGEAVARKFKTEGYYVIGTGTGRMDKPEYLDDYVACDFTKLDDIDMLCQYVTNSRLTTLVNNAGINIINNFCEIEPVDFIKVQQVNVYAPFRISQSALPSMIKRKWGRIVNVSSVWGKISKQGRASYSASKFGIDGLTLAMANEFASQGILCNSVAPGFIDTEMTWKNLGQEGVARMLENVPIGRLAKVDEVANLVYMLGSEQNTYISGQNISIDGGFTRA
jgi:NAD(P)-dependent dehydrogenase (short-subunit alcohol dehydrogenase family)